MTQTLASKPHEDTGVARHCRLEIVNKRGLHARASAKFVKCAEGFDAEITVSKDGQSVCGTSIMGLLTLGASPGCFIEVAAKGLDADQALAALTKLVETGFGEERCH